MDVFSYVPTHVKSEFVRTHDNASSPAIFRRWLPLVFMGVIASRLPFLWTGYGADPDAWRVARSGQHLWQTGMYEPSRFPGYPLHELISAPLVALGGAPLSNGATLGATLLLLIVWARFVNRDATHPKILIASLAFTPLLWIHSAATMDYAWSLLFILLSLVSTQKGNIAIAGMWLGVAVGFRPPNVVACVPLIAFLNSNKRSPKEIARFSLVATVTALVAFLPPLLAYGPIGWLSQIKAQIDEVKPAFIDQLLFFGYRSVYAFGPAAVIASLLIVLHKRHEIGHLIRSCEPVAFMSLAGLISFLGLFLLFPLERGYLLPALPFLLLLLDRVASRRMMIVFVLCLISFAVFNIDVIQHHGVRGTPGLNVRWGMVIEEWEKRKLLFERRKALSTYPFLMKSIVMTGAGDSFSFENHYVEPDTARFWSTLSERTVRLKRVPDIHFTTLLTRSELELVRSAGYTVYCPEHARAYIEFVTGYNLEDAEIIIVKP